MSFSNTYETIVLKFAFNADSVTRPTNWYLGLFTSNPGEGGGTEISGNGYTRKAVTFTVTGDTATNSGAVEFDVATGSWGTISHVAVFDAASGGAQIAYAALTTAKAIDTGDVLRFPVGDVDITLD
tara:strand:+ start:4504 stop:4881 length:378 start_codon:yes stop_codon:yes gene_type:complete